MEFFLSAGCDSVAGALKRSLLVAGWFVFLTFPLLAVRVDTIEKTVTWRLENMIYVAVAMFGLSYIWRWALERKRLKVGPGLITSTVKGFMDKASEIKQVRWSFLIGVLACAAIFPQFGGMYYTKIMISCLTYVVLGLGLNIVIGLAGLLHLGYGAFYAVGAYTYALAFLYYGGSFWMMLPIGIFLGVVFALGVGLPVLRLRGDYLAIVTLGFGEIVRLVLENWGSFTQGPSGISRIPYPTLFGHKFGIIDAYSYIYYIALGMVLLTIFLVNRIENSRMGRALLAMREDEIASQAMGIDITKTKMMAFALGSCWAGMAGVLFAATNTFVNPASFTFWESAIILSIVVIGGMGSIPGVIVGAVVLILVPEFLREIQEFRMLAFGTIMVLVMVFKPEGLIRAKRKIYRFKKKTASAEQ